MVGSACGLRGTEVRIVHRHRPEKKLMNATCNIHGQQNNEVLGTKCNVLVLLDINAVVGERQVRMMNQRIEAVLRPYQLALFFGQWCGPTRRTGKQTPSAAPW